MHTGLSKYHPVKVGSKVFVYKSEVISVRQISVSWWGCWTTQNDVPFFFSLKLNSCVVWRVWSEPRRLHQPRAQEPIIEASVGCSYTIEGGGVLLGNGSLWLLVRSQTGSVMCTNTPHPAMQESNYRAWHDTEPHCSCAALRKKISFVVKIRMSPWMCTNQKYHSCPKLRLPLNHI